MFENTAPELPPDLLNDGMSRPRSLSTVGATDAARWLGCSRSCLYRLIHRFIGDSRPDCEDATTPNLCVSVPHLGALQRSHGRWRFDTDSLETFLCDLLEVERLPSSLRNPSSGVWIGAKQAWPRLASSSSSFYRDLFGRMQIRWYRGPGRVPVEIRTAPSIAGIKFPDGRWQFARPLIERFGVPRP